LNEVKWDGAFDGPSTSSWQVQYCVEGVSFMKRYVLERIANKQHTSEREQIGKRGAGIKKEGSVRPAFDLRWSSSVVLAEGERE